MGPARLRASVEQSHGFASDPKMCLLTADGGLANQPAVSPLPPIPPDFDVTPLLSSAAKPAQDASATAADVLSEVSLQAFRQAIARIVSQPVQVPGIANSLVAVIPPDVQQQRIIKPLLTMSEDVTATLPVAAGRPAPLGNQDYADAAARNTVSVPAMKSVAVVGSGGKSGFDATGRPNYY